MEKEPNLWSGSPGLPGTIPVYRDPAPQDPLCQADRAGSVLHSPSESWLPQLLQLTSCPAPCPTTTCSSLRGPFRLTLKATPSEGSSGCNSVKGPRFHETVPPPVKNPLTNWHCYYCTSLFLLGQDWLSPIPSLLNSRGSPSRHTFCCLSTPVPMAKGRVPGPRNKH